MRPNHLALVFSLTLLNPLFAAAQAPDGSPLDTRTAQATCLFDMQVDRGTTYLDQARQQGAVLDDWLETIPAGEFDGDSDYLMPIGSGDAFGFGGRSLLWYNTETQNFRVDGQYFSDLQSIDVPRMPSGQRLQIGVFIGESQESIAPRAVVEFLIRTGILRTFWHIGAELCFVEETETDGTYRVVIDAVHTYYTNEENRDSYGFAVTIDTEGVIIVEAIGL